MPLSRYFYNRNPVDVARDLLGKKLVRGYQGIVLSGMINETEAYLGKEDSASHAFREMTPRNKTMFGPPGHAYVYLIYGMYHMLNVVAGEENVPWAVLVRSVVPLEGIEAMRKCRGGTKELADGPGKLCKAFRIEMDLNGWDLTSGRVLWIEDYKTVPEKDIERTRRIGVDYAMPEHRDAELRFLIRS